MRSYREITYKQIGGHPLSMQVFEPDGRTRLSERPCIVMFRGSSWIDGFQSQLFPQCSYLASRGMVAIAADYRVRSTHGTTPFECVKDARSAMRYVRSHASELGIDGARIAGGGASAGGQMAAAAALLDTFDEPGEDTSVSCRPDALVLFNPVIDNGPRGYGHDRVQERWREFSVLHNVAPGAPPTILFLGSDDYALSVESAERFAELMRDAGSRCDVHVYPGQQHGFFNYLDGHNEYYFETMREADRFLGSIGYLEGEPTL